VHSKKCPPKPPRKRAFHKGVGEFSNFVSAEHDQNQSVKKVSLKNTLIKSVKQVSGQTKPKIKVSKKCQRKSRSQKSVKQISKKYQKSIIKVSAKKQGVKKVSKKCPLKSSKNQSVKKVSLKNTSKFKVSKKCQVETPPDSKCRKSVWELQANF